VIPASFASEVPSAAAIIVVNVPIDDSRFEAGASNQSEDVAVSRVLSVTAVDVELQHIAVQGLITPVVITFSVVLDSNATEAIAELDAVVASGTGAVDSTLDAVHCVDWDADNSTWSDASCELLGATRDVTTSGVRYTLVELL
jgi:hypothetical protein